MWGWGVQATGGRGAGGTLSRGGQQPLERAGDPAGPGEEEGAQGKEDGPQEWRPDGLAPDQGALVSGVPTVQWCCGAPPHAGQGPERGS